MPEHSPADRPLNVTQLMTLALVAQYGSFTRAAEAMGVSQPSVSQQIHDLERTTGFPLVTPQGRSIKMTSLGRELADIGRRIGIERERASRAIEQHRDGSAGRLLVAASMTTSTYVLPPIIARLQRDRPAATIELRVANTYDVAQMVSDDLVDLGVVEGDVDRPELVARAFAGDQLTCIAPPRSPLRGRVLHPADVRDEVLLVREDGSGTRGVVLEALSDRALEFARVIAFGTNETIKAAVRNGLGIAWLSRRAVEGEIAAHSLAELRFAAPPIEREFRVIRRRDVAPSPLGQAFMALLDAPDS